MQESKIKWHVYYGPRCIQNSTAEIDDRQFVFMKSKGITDAIFIVRQMQENFRVKGNKLSSGFVDLKRAFDRFRENRQMGNA